MDSKAPDHLQCTESPVRQDRAGFRFAFFGGNSQVAIETALILQHMGHHVVLFGRSAYPEFPLKLFGLQYRQEPQGAPSTTTQREIMQAQLADMDVVVEFAFPAGQPWDIVPQACERLDYLNAITPAHAVLAHMSSISAYGMPGHDSRLRWWRWPASTYAAGKRAVERYAQRLNRKGSVYSFRLGQVHGVLQSVSHEYRTAISQARLHVEGELVGASATVFCESVALSLQACAERAFQPGVWPLLSAPQWRVCDLLAFYQHLENHQPVVDAQQTLSPSWRQRLMMWARSFLLAHRDRIEPILFHFPKLAAKVKARYRVQSVVHTSDREVTHLTCLAGNISEELPPIASPNWVDTLANFRAREQLIRSFIERAMVHRQYQSSDHPANDPSATPDSI